MKKKSLFAVLDYETTGLPFHPLADLDLQPRAIEFAGIITDGIEVIDTLEFICNPWREIEPIITQITGLTNEDLEAQEPWVVQLPRIKDYLSQANVVIAHNLSFDKGIFRNELRHAGLTFEDINWPKIEICTVEQTIDKYGRRMKLTELYNMLVGEYVQKHRALDDVLLLHEVCKSIGVYDMFNKGGVK
ncbi:DNA polymerase III PolC-type epsilon subunit [Aeromonas phage Gekk3-15]